MPLDKQWQKTLASILQSDTGDLRELAALAGGDPRTFYVGTSLDGADLRGQDLRGMLLPQLDLSKVRRDEATVLDGDTEDAPELARAPLIYVSEQDVDRKAIERLAQFTPLILAQRARESFLEAATTHAAPVIILAWDEVSNEARYASEELTARGRPHVVLVIETPGSRRRTDQRRLARDLESVVIVPTGWSLFSHTLLPIPPAAIDAVGVISELWKDRAPWFHQRHMMFFTARGAGPARQRDAAAQIFHRAHMMGLTPAHSTMVVPSPPEGRKLIIDEPARRLLRAEEGFLVNRGWARPRLDVAVFGDFREAAGDIFYADAVKDAARPHSLLAPDRMTGMGRNREIPLLVSADATVISRAETLPDPRTLDPATIQSAVISPHAEFEQIVDRLAIGELWLNARDVVGIVDDFPTVWSAIAAQLKRADPAVGDGAQAAYLEMLLRCAFARDRVELSNSDPLIEALNDRAFSGRHDLRISRVGIRDGMTSGLVTITARDLGSPLGPMKWRYRLSVAWDGPSVKWVEAAANMRPLSAAD